MAGLVQTWHHRVIVADEETSCLEIHVSYGAHTPIGTAQLVIPLPLPDNVSLNATVIVEASLDGVWLSGPLFTGTVRQLEPAVVAGGVTTTISCEGDAYRLTFPVGRLAFAGNAPAAPQTVTTTPAHIGTATIAHYADDIGNGIEVDYTVTPSTDSDFVWLAGILHGSNSYDTSIGDLTIKTWSKVDVYQSGDKLGYANLPESNEDWDDTLDYTDPANWEDFEVFITAPIVAAAGNVTFRFRAGRKPGSSAYDEYEIDDVTWQTAGKQSIRQMIRGLCKRCGVPEYVVHDITDLDGNVIYLGGNGLVDAGQVVIDRREQPIAFISRILDLFGFALFDTPEGVVRVDPFRGNPTGSAVATFTEGTTILGVPRATIDPRSVYNDVLVTGASGNDQDGKRFAYQYRTASPVGSAYIPDPPGERLLTLSNRLLISNALCEQAGEIAEANTSGAHVVTFVTWPHVLRPAQIVEVNAPTAGFVGNAFVESITYDIDSGGYRMVVSVWDGSAVEISETPDPDPDEDDIEPSEPRPDDEWAPYSPFSGVA